MIILDDGIKKVDLSEFGFRALADHDNNSGPSFNMKTVKIPGMLGSWEFGAEIGAKQFNIPVTSFDLEEFSFQKKVDEINKFLLDSHRQPKLIKLIFDYEKDKFYNVRLADSTALSRESLLKNMVIPFVASDPVKYAKSNEYDPSMAPIYGEVEKGDHYKNTQSFDWLYLKHYSGIHNYSSFVTVLKITIKGTLKNASITHIQSKIKLTLPDIKNQTLIVDSKRFNVTVNGRDSFNSNLDFFEILPGDNGFLFESENPNATVKFEWLHQF